MLEQLLHHIQKNNLIRSGEKVLLAVSGGIDSMVMADLFSRAEISFGVAHCNFSLRGQESDADERFIRDYCLNAKIPFHAEKFDTEEYAEQNGLSIQVAARKLRYAFFRKIAESEGYHAVATAHHQDDSIETVLLNLVRGTGIDGLTGIPVRNDIFVRPLLFALRRDILLYAREKNLRWREDSSNAEVYYKRNLLRLHVMPLLKQINPHFDDTFIDTLDRIKGAKALVDFAVKEFSTANVHVSGHTMHIALPALKGYDHAEVLLWTIVKEYGFNFQQCRQMLSSHQPGKIFLSTTHRLLIDRDHLVIEKHAERDSDAVIINEVGAPVKFGQTVLHFKICNGRDYEIDRDERLAQLDLAKVQFPLTWRGWIAGDAFSPLGMKNKKKISDLLIDQKIPVHEKDQVTVLESGGRIAWVVGIRVSDAFKIDDQTQQVLLIKAAMDKQ